MTVKALSYKPGVSKSTLMLDTSLPLSVTWEPMGDGKKVISLADNHLLLWDLQESSSQAVVSKRILEVSLAVFLESDLRLNSEYTSFFFLGE
jgi:hypothetical protein